MTSSASRTHSVAHTTEITVLTGDRFRVAGDPKDVERAILDAARGSLMQLAWLTDAETRKDLALNPEHVVMLRAVSEP